MEAADCLQGACDSSGIVNKISSVLAFSLRKIRALAVESIKKFIHHKELLILVYLSKILFKFYFLDFFWKSKITSRVVMDSVVWVTLCLPSFAVPEISQAS